MHGRRSAAGLREAFAGALGNCRTGTQRFNTAALAAAAARTAIVDAEVSAFGGASGASVIDALIEDNSGADAGAERGVEHILKADACAPDGFGESGGVRVIIDANAEPKGALDF